MKYIFILIVFFSLGTMAQKLPSIADKTKEMKKQEGFLNFYWEASAGKIWLEISQLDTEILYQRSLPAGLGSNDIGLDRGLLGETSVIRFSRVGGKLLMIAPNYDYRASANNVSEQQAVAQSFAQSVLWGFAIEAETAGSVLVDATDFIVRDIMNAANRIRTADQGNYTFDKTRSALYLPATKNFPLNTEIEATVSLVNTDGRAGNYIKSVTPSAEVITLRMHHSFVQLPDKEYQPRVFDIRSSFINTSYFDYSTPVSEPILKNYIIRHRLKKKDPSAPVSEPVKPIVYYLDNGVPEPIRSALLEGGSWWNQAFVSAGYKDAFQIKVLPEGADPMDIRYNMINWVHRSTRGWSYGAAVVDPRTGEIIKGNVLLGSLRVRQDYLIAEGLLAPYEKGVPADDKMLKMALNRLKQLSAHEIGHTIGLMHNYAASVSNRASVMDYPHPLVKLDANGHIDLSNAYDLQIGEWDKVAIAWGYQDFPPGVNEAEALDKILSDASARGLKYLSDRDARPPGSAHPSAHLWDNGPDPVAELEAVKKIRNNALARFGENNIRQGQPLALLEDVLVPVYFYHRYQLEAASKLVGALDYSYAIRGDGQLITKAVPRADQLKALKAIAGCLDPAFLALPEKIMALIPPRPSGYEIGRELFPKRTGIVFDALSPAETAANYTLSFLLNVNRLNRMTQYEVLYGGLSPKEMMDQLCNQFWKSPPRKGMENLIQRQTGQVLLTYLLAASIDEEASFETRAQVQNVLEELKKYMELQLKTARDENLIGHYRLALERMKAPEKEKPARHKTIPPGAPIGCGDWDLR
ncbi:MAG: zinc-dependent metalloprotease [Chitinophagaceae bacterium]|nr:zinc-dependent metalloprotease [Chitinophagaceae bacterium]